MEAEDRVGINGGDGGKEHMVEEGRRTDGWVEAGCEEGW
jgi:hypothetical protein